MISHRIGVWHFKSSVYFRKSVIFTVNFGTVAGNNGIVNKYEIYYNDNIESSWWLKYLRNSKNTNWAFMTFFPFLSLDPFWSISHLRRMLTPTNRHALVHISKYLVASSWSNIEKVECQPNIAKTPHKSACSHANYKHCTSRSLLVLVHRQSQIEPWPFWKWWLFHSTRHYSLQLWLNGHLFSQCMKVI